MSSNRASSAAPAGPTSAPVATPPLPGSLPWACDGSEPLPFHDAVTEAKRRILADAIARAGGNKAEAARLLGLQRTYLYRLEKQLGEK